MKKILKKNQIIITALVVMVAIAGYLSMTDREELTMNGHGDHNKAATESSADISEEDIVLDEDEETADAASGKAVSTSGQKVSNKENAGEAVLVSNTVTGNYFEEAKLSREQTRAKNKETLTNLVNNKNVTNAQKDKAMQQIMQMTEISEKETATENLLGVRVEQKLSFDEMFADLDMPDTDETVSRSFLTNEITRFGRVLSVTLAPYGALDGEGGVIAVIHDVTEQRRLDDARREFVANVSHELRTPLTNIRSYTETLLDAAGELPLDTEKQFLGVISSESERMARIVTDLLTLSKLDYGRMELRMTRFSVSDLLKKVTNAMKLTAEDSGHMILVETEPNLPPMVGDRERIEQVVVNILSNAVKYTPSGGRIRLTAQRAGANHVRVTVEDNGVGIPADDVPRLFERFYRVDKARSRAAGGTGLGLAIAKEIVEQHEGKIALTSEYGKGTTVTITLPTDLKPHGREDKV